jgi:hypothetical protein
MEQQLPQLPPQEEEIDLIALAKKVWNGRKTIFIALGIAAVLGLFMALGATKKFSVSTVMVPQVATGGAKSGLSGLAALAGINMDMTQNPELSPVIYPKIVSSIPFKLEMMNVPIKFEDVDFPVSLIDYVNVYKKKTVIGTITKYTIGLPGIIMKAFKGKTKIPVAPSDGSNQPIYLTKEQYELVKAMNEIMSLSVDIKEGYLTLTVNLSDPVAAAQFAQKAQELLQKEIIKFKIEKAQAELNFIQGRYDLAKAEMEKAQVDLAVNEDRSRFFTSELSSVGKERIQTRYNIAYAVYQQLATQLEQAKIQVAKDTPAFTIVEPVTVPSPDSGKPSKKMILLIWIFVGGVVGVALIFAKEFYQTIKTKWNETEEVEEKETKKRRQENGNQRPEEKETETMVKGE